MKIVNLSKKFGDITVFSDFSCEIADGKITYVLGKSGIGKTTLFRIISGLDKEYSGNVEFNGNVAYVFQEHRLFPTLNLMENLRLVSSIPEDNIIEILRLIELDGAQNKFPSELSGGMAMRASIARALCYNADIYLLDEPFASLDEEMKERIADRVFSYLKGKTVIVISHDSENANKYAENILDLNKISRNN